MNRVEKCLYDLLKRNPRLKYFIRNMYQSLFDVLPDKMNYFATKIICKENYFFGFHDVSPFSGNDQYVLAHKIYIPLRMPNEEDYVGVGYWDMELNEYKQVDKSYAWNYHKGCRLQWLNAQTQELIYNTRINNELRSVIFSVLNNSKLMLNYPVDATSNDGLWATSFSYERLEKFMPGYGYDIKDASFLEDRAPRRTGMFIIDINTNKANLVFSLFDLSKVDPEETMKDAWHYVTHSQFSPDGEYIAFLHRWVQSNDLEKRYSRLITCRKDGSDISISPTSGMVSHYHWDRIGLIVYCSIENIDGHYFFGDHYLKNPRLIAKNDINSDGHQHFIPNRVNLLLILIPTEEDLLNCT